MRKKSVGVICAVLFALAGGTAFSKTNALPSVKTLPVPHGLWIMRRAYPDVLFEAEFDFARLDWRVDVTAPIFYEKHGKSNEKHATFY